MDWMPQTIREGLFTILFISGPLVILAAVLGLVIGVIQAATQVQEQTLASAVKIIGLFLALIVFGFYMFQYLTKYTSDSLQRAFKLVPSLGSYVKPRNNFLSRKPESQALDAPRPPAELEEMNIPKPGGSKISEGEINEPELARSNQSQSGLDRLGKPSMQIKTENPNLKKQDLPARQAPVTVQPARQAPAPAPAAVQPARQAPAPAPVKQPVRQPAVQPARQAPAPAPAAVQPARQAPAPAPVKQPVRQPAVQPARQAPAPAPVATAPAESVIPVRTTPRVEPERRSLSDAVNRLKSNFNEPVGAQ
jgi:flagellar biosynthetic protein FliQ